MDESPAPAAQYSPQSPRRASPLQSRAHRVSEPARTRFRALEEVNLERVRREIRLRRNFLATDFDGAYEAFRSLYHVRPSRVSCSPDILERFCALFERSVHYAHSRHVQYRGIPMHAAIVPPGVVAFEGEIDETRMGDW